MAPDTTVIPVLQDEDLQTLTNIARLPGEHRTAADRPLSEILLARQAQTESAARSYPRKLPFALAQARGLYVKDVDGNVYYDCLSGAGAIALGHNHEVVQEAIRRELDANLPMLTLDITTPVKDQFVQEILSLFPPGFAANAKVQFCGPSGADAVEAAIKLVKIATGRRGIAAFHGGYHGMTHGALSLMGNLGAKTPIPGLMSDVHFLPYPYAYRNPMGVAADTEGRLSSNYIETVLTDDESGVPLPAGVIVEPVQGEGGKIPAPDAWMQELRRITSERGIPLIVDEIQSGLGRTGKMFAFMHAGIIPDVVVLSKAIGGSLPMALVVYHKDLDVWGPGAHAGTFRGNQLGMAAGTATIQFIKEHKLDEHAAAMGEVFMEQLRAIQQDTTCIGDVRGRGLMIGVEIVNRKSGVLKGGQPEGYQALTGLIQAECFERGLIVETGGRQGSVLRFLPPLTIRKAQVLHICQLFGDALRSAEAKLLG